METEAVQVELPGQVGTAGMGFAAHPEARRAPDTTPPNGRHLVSWTIL